MFSCKHARPPLVSIAHPARACTAHNLRIMPELPAVAALVLFTATRRARRLCTHERLPIGMLLLWRRWRRRRRRLQRRLRQQRRLGRRLHVLRRHMVVVGGDVAARGGLSGRNRGVRPARDARKRGAAARGAGSAGRGTRKFAKVRQARACELRKVSRFRL